MLQVVFSDSERGSLKLATHCSCINSEDGPIGFIFGEGETTPEEQERAMAKLKAQWEEEKRRARPVGGSPGDVLCPSYGLDMGPLSGPNVDKARFNLLTAWLGGDFPLPDSTPEDYAQQRDQMWEQRQQDRSRLLETAENGEVQPRRTLVPVWVLRSVLAASELRLPRDRLRTASVDAEGGRYSTVLS